MQIIKIDLSQNGGKIKPMNAVNNGPVSDRRAQRGNDETYKAAHIPYARNHDASFHTGYGGEHTVDVHRIFKNFDADENDPASYVFGPTDKCVTATFDAGTEVFYRLGASIEHGHKYGTYPPKDYLKWARICEHIIRHYTEGWADGFNYKIEYWEIWNEPELHAGDGSRPCWQGTNDEFTVFYCTVAPYLKEKFPHLKIGGAAFCSSDITEFSKSFLKAVKDGNIPLDFYSYHCYANNPDDIYKSAVRAKNHLAENGLENCEIILDEYNYVRGWRGEDYIYSMDSMKGIKGSSFFLGSMLACQESPLDMLMYYEARPCAWCGIWATEGLYPLKSYYSLLMFDALRQLGTWVKTDYVNDSVYYCAATNGKDSALALTYFNEDDSTPAKEVAVEFENLGTPDGAKVECFLLDENNDMKLVSKYDFVGDKFKVHLDMTLFSSYLIKITAL